MLVWGKIRRWDERYLFDAADDVRGLRQKMIDAQRTLETADRNFTSTGLTADAIRRTSSKLFSQAGARVQECSEIMMALADTADDVWNLRCKIMECEQFAEVNQVLIDPETGTVDPNTDELIAQYGLSRTSPAVLLMEKRINAAIKLEAMIEKTLQFAHELQQDLADRLKRAMDEGLPCHSAEKWSSHSPGLPDLPQSGWSAAEVAQWWKALSEADKQWLVDHHPEAIGNCDGVEFSWRHKANVARIDLLLRSAEAELERLRLQGAEDDWASLTQDSPFNVQQGRVNDLRKLHEAFLSSRANPRYSLLTLDVSGHRVKAAVGIGNVDKADHVSIFVPGMGTRVDSSFDHYVGDSKNILDQMNRELRESASPQSSASVAWLGYDAPGAFGEDNFMSVGGTKLAHAGADRLTAFTEGMESTHRLHGDRDSHVTVIGHSYGSTTTGFAAAQVKPGVIDDIVLFGSPGSGVQSVEEYNITSGVPYAIGVDPSQDWVQDSGPDGSFGKDPMKMEGFHHLDNYSPSPGDPNAWSKIARHGTDVYLHENSRSLRDIARVATGTYERS